MHGICKILLGWLVLLVACGNAAPAQDASLELSAADLPRLLTELKPQPGESPWREIAWLTNVTEARRRARAEDKPIVIFVAADGSPLSRT